MLRRRRKMFSLMLATLASVGIVSLGSVLAMAESGSDGGMTVTTSFEDNQLTMDISGIAHTQKDQMLTYTLVQEEAGSSQEQLIYTDAKYINGQDAITLSFPVSVSSLEDCVLVVNNEVGDQKVVIDFSSKTSSEQPDSSSSSSEDPGSSSSSASEAPDSSTPESEAPESQPSSTGSDGSSTSSSPEQGGDISNSSSVSEASDSSAPDAPSVSDGGSQSENQAATGDGVSLYLPAIMGLAACSVIVAVGLIRSKSLNKTGYKGMSREDF